MGVRPAHLNPEAGEGHTTKRRPSKDMETRTESGDAQAEGTENANRSWHVCPEPREGDEGREVRSEGSQGSQMQASPVGQEKEGNKKFSVPWSSGRARRPQAAVRSGRCRERGEIKSQASQPGAPWPQEAQAASQKGH